MTKRQRRTLVTAVLGALALSGCQVALGDGGTACPNFECGATATIEAVTSNGGLGGTAELYLARRVYGQPIPVFQYNHLIGDVTCLAQEGGVATVVFQVDPARSTITFEHAAAYSISVSDGGPGATQDGWSYEAATGDLSSCALPGPGYTFVPVEWGGGYDVGSGVAPWE